MEPSDQKDQALPDRDRALLDQLLSDSNLYRSSRDFQERLDFTVRLRNMAPFNAMLLQIQKPGLSYAASAYDWRHRFKRTIKENSRPVLILWPFGPVALVYDLIDTEGQDLPKDAIAFYSVGAIDDQRLETFFKILDGKNIRVESHDQGDRWAGGKSKGKLAPPKRRSIRGIGSGTTATAVNQRPSSLLPTSWPTCFSGTWEMTRS